MSKNVKETLTEVLEQDNATNLDKITQRRCTSDRRDGIEYRVYGSYIEIRPIIDVFATMDGVAIETLSVSNEDGYVVIFAAPLRSQEHPAFFN